MGGRALGESGDAAAIQSMTATPRAIPTIMLFIEHRIFIEVPFVVFEVEGFTAEYGGVREGHRVDSGRIVD